LISDASGFEGWADRLIAPHSEAELEFGAPLTLVGGNTGVTGGSVPHGGTRLSLQHFTKLRIRPGSATVGAGVLLKDLQAAAARTGQFYPPDPTETWASVGGTIATNASGSRSFKYGSTRKWIRSLKVATMDGQIRTYSRGDQIDFDVPALPVPRTTKTTAGYPLQPGMDWIDLFTGSEGTLGIVLEAELTLLPQPADLLTGIVFFPGEPPDDWRAIPGLRMLEYFDRNSLRLLDAPGNSALLIEQENPDLDAWDLTGTVESWFGIEPADRERFRQFRHQLPERVNEEVRKAGQTKVGSDFAVPIDRNLDMLHLYQERCEQQYPGRYVIFGHYGDAHLHVNLFHCEGYKLLTEFAEAAVNMGGTVSAEHGLGKRKRDLLKLQFTPAEIQAMRDVKTRLDPNWFLGRGTLFESF
jgi:FAD/FMN-containing dehydrogenase